MSILDPVKTRTSESIIQGHSLRRMKESKNIDKVARIIIQYKQRSLILSRAMSQ